MSKFITQTLATAAAAAMLAIALVAPANAALVQMQRKGIKCGWVLVSSVGGVNTYNYVCSRGV